MVKAPAFFKTIVATNSMHKDVHVQCMDIYNVTNYDASFANMLCRGMLQHDYVYEGRVYRHGTGWHKNFFHVNGSSIQVAYDKNLQNTTLVFMPGIHHT